MKKFFSICVAFIMACTLIMGSGAVTFAYYQPETELQQAHSHAISTPNSTLILNDGEAPLNEPVLTVTQSNSEARPGKQGILYFTLSQGANISSFAFTIKYNTEYITVNSVDKAVNLKGDNFVVNFDNVGEIIVNFVGSENITAETKLFNVTYTLSESVQNGTVLQNAMWLDTEYPPEFYNASGVEVTVENSWFRFGVIRAGKMGDLIGEDDTVSARDLLILQRSIVRMVTLTEEQKKVADINGDGKVNTLDAQYLKMYLVGKIDSLVIGTIKDAEGNDIDTVQEEIKDNFYTVTFIGFGGQTIDVQTAREGLTLTPPNAPDVEGYTFTGWSSTAYENIKTDVTIYAQYEAETYTVEFQDYDGTPIGEAQNIAYGNAAKAPATPVREATETAYYNFTGWDVDYSSVKNDLVVKAVYEEIPIESNVKYYTVTFIDYNNDILSEQKVKAGGSATAPTDPIREGYIFKEWDESYKNILKDTEVKAVYVASTLKVDFVDYDMSLIYSINVSYGGTVIAPTAPSREGYIFAGWSSGLTNITSSQTIIAQYKKVDTEKAQTTELGAYHVYNFVEDEPVEGSKYSYIIDVEVILAEGGICELEVQEKQVYLATGEVLEAAIMSLRGTFVFNDANQCVLTIDNYGSTLIVVSILYTDGTAEIIAMEEEQVNKTLTTQLGVYMYEAREARSTLNQSRTA